MRVSREFKQNFDLVARYYGLAELGELEEVKEAVRRSPETAAVCFAEMGRWVRSQQVALPSVSSLPTITHEQIDAKTSQLNQARQRGIVRDVRGAGRDHRLGAFEPPGARQGKKP